MKTIIITGMPRSGTSWLGQIFNSHPGILFRTEPLFAYRFKGAVDMHSSCEEISKFVSDLIEIDDDFILQKEMHLSGFYPNFTKTSPQAIAFKTTRNHELITRYIECLPDVHIVAIVRHPCGAINSWINSYTEFCKQGCSIEMDWRTGSCRKNNLGEYWGFDDWLSSTLHFIEKAEAHKNFHLIRYADLVSDALTTVSNIFDEICLDVSDQTRDFLAHCNSRHDENSYSVFKNKQVLNMWRTELQADIVNEIILDCKKSGLGFFLE